MSTPKVLFMDDDYDVRLLAERMARRLGLQLELAADDVQAIAAFTAALDDGEAFDAVVLDVTIPGRRGAVEVLAALRALEPAIPAVVTSGYSEGGVVASFEDFGFGAALAKPFGHVELGAAIDRALATPVRPGRLGPR